MPLIRTINSTGMLFFVNWILHLHAGRRQPSMRGVRQAEHAKALDPALGAGNGKNPCRSGRPRVNALVQGIALAAASPYLLHQQDLPCLGRHFGSVLRTPAGCLFFRTSFSLQIDIA